MLFCCRKNGWGWNNFIAEADAGKGLRFPIILHCRDAFADLFPIVQQWIWRAPGNCGVFHAFDGSAEEARRITDAGFFVGLGGAITFKNKPLRREMARTVPLEKIVLETDAPYLTFVPYRGKRNQPAYVPLVGAFLAELRGLPVEDVMTRTSANAFELFRLS